MTDTHARSNEDLRWCWIAGQRDSTSNGGLSYMVLVCEIPVAVIPNCDPPELPARHRFRGPRKARSSHGGPTFRVMAHAMRATGRFRRPSGTGSDRLGVIRRFVRRIMVRARKAHRAMRRAGSWSGEAGIGQTGTENPALRRARRCSEKAGRVYDGVFL